MAARGNRGTGNPFEFGQAVHADSIVDRDEELRRLQDAVRNGERLFLIGPRRFGKTSLLNVVQHQLERDGVVVLKYDVEKFESTELLARALLAGAIRALAGPAEKFGAVVNRQLKRFFGALKPAVSYDVMAHSISVSFGIARNPKDSDLALLTDVLDGINAMARAGDKTVAVVLDEFQQLVAAGGIAAERQIRAAVQTHRHVSYIFAGSKTRLLTDMTSHHARPFYRMGSSLFLGPVPRATFIPFIREGFERHGFKVAAGAVERILELVEDVPYSVQRLAHRCWDLLCAGGPGAQGALTSAFVERALERIALEEDPAYTQLWMSLTAVQKKALKAVISSGGRLLLSKAVTVEHSLSAASMQKALQALNDRGIIREEQSAGAVRLRLDDPLLATWLKAAQAT
jgi:energy-coupling factor transporter ATP-binding protein EcfA2